tara:strand:- start:2794 stop:2988 length:195 start_codon:yes stop_codon:yes gene_type:complete
MGILDKTIRVVIGLAVYGLFMLKFTTGWIALSTVTLGNVFLLTAFVNICPLYKVLGVKTCTAYN